MSTRTQGVVIVACDACREDAQNDDECGIWFSSLTDAEGYLVGNLAAGDRWLFGPGRLICDECIKARACRIFGHVPAPMHPSYAAPLDYCTRCRRYGVLPEEVL